jgi:hypothetical protein
MNIRHLIIPLCCLPIIAPACKALAWESTSTARYAKNVLKNIANEKSAEKTVNAKFLQPQQIIVPYSDENAISIGEGIDLITGQRKLQKCVNFPGTARVVFYNKNSNFGEVVDDESLWRKMTTSISARASYAGYSGGGSYDSTVETKTSSKSVTTVAKANVTDYVEMISTGDAKDVNSIVDLSQNAIDKLATPTEFRSVCGDGFVVQIAYGANLVGTLQFKSREYEEKKNTKAAVDASGPAGVFKVNGNLQLEQTFKSTKTSTDLTFIERGGAPESIPVSRDDLVSSFQSLSKRARDSERPLYITVLRYSALPSGRDKSYVEVVSGLEAMITRALRLKTLQNEVVEAVVKRRDYEQDTADTKFKSHDYVFFPAIEFNKRTAAGLGKFADELHQEIDETAKSIQKCLDDPSTINCTNASSTDFYDMINRASTPLPLNEIPSGSLESIYKYIKEGSDLPKLVATCKLAFFIQQTNVYRVNDVRCRENNECLKHDDLLAASNKVYDDLSVNGKTALNPTQCGQESVVKELLTDSELRNQLLALSPKYSETFLPRLKSFLVDEAGE